MAEVSTSFSVAADHPCLEGHFPGRPIVPAALLLDLAAQLARDHAGQRRLTGVAHAKFLQPVLPEQPLRLLLRIDGARAAFRIESPLGLAAQGELRFAPDAAAGTTP